MTQQRIIPIKAIGQVTYLDVHRRRRAAMQDSRPITVDNRNLSQAWGK